jgi:cobalamin-dependent methionine synthase I
MSDFVHANHDEVYVFATSVQQPPSQDLDDPYNSLLSQTISDRLAEAAAEKLQMQLVEEGRLSGHQVIRPAVGYPMIPDMSINFLLNELCDMSRIGIQLTENGMMHPHASVSGFMIANPHACYFAVGPISEEQLADYARRRGYTIERMRKFINAL